MRNTQITLASPFGYYLPKEKKYKNRDFWKVVAHEFIHAYFFLWSLP